MPARPSPLLLSTIGSASLVGLGGVVSLGLANGYPVGNVLVLSWVTVTYTVSGLVAWWCRPANRMGPLMLLAGAGCLASSLGRADQSLLHTGYLAAVPGLIAVMLLGGLQPHLLTVFALPGPASVLYHVVLTTVSAV